MRAVAVVALLALSAPALAQGIVIGGTNLPLLGYQKHSCHQPRLPYSNDQWAWDSFQSEAERYRDCIETYIENAENDVKRIINAQEAAIDEWNRFLRSIQ